MNGLNYLFQCNLYLIIFYGFYWLLLRKETFNNFNRAYLVISGLVSFAIPLWNLDLIQSWFVTQNTTIFISQIHLPEYVITDPKVEKAFDITNYLSVIYGIGCAILGLKLVMNIFNLYRYMYGIIPISKAFSFFNNIFIAEGLDPDDVIYDHERIHASQYHSFDVLLFEIIGIFCWFNPIIYLYKMAIKNIHEFIADDLASKKMKNKYEYAMLLFSEQFQTHPSVLVSNFFTKTSLKLRIEMLNKKRSNKIAVLKYGLIFPVFLGMLIFTSASIANGENMASILNKIDSKTVTGLIINVDNKPVIGANVIIKNGNKATTTDLNGAFSLNVANENNTIVVSHVGYESTELPITNNEKLAITLKRQVNSLMETAVVAYSPNFFKDTVNNEPIDNKSIKDEIFAIVEENAKFPGGDEEMGKFLGRNLIYTDEARKNNIQGKVFTKFIVKADGDISNIRILKGMGNGLDEETVRVIGKMPKWEPAKQNGKAVNSEYVLPVAFYLGNTASISNVPPAPPIPPVVPNSPKTPPMPPVPPKPPVNIFDTKTNKGVNADLYILNGTSISKTDFGKITKEEIYSINILNAKEAIHKYGSKGKNGAILLTTKAILQEDIVMEVTDKMAEFEGGNAALGNYLAKSLRYPQEAQKNNKSGKVFVTFVVRKSGEITDVKLLKGQGFGLDQEAIRVINAMPKWLPAQHKGQVVSSRFNMPIAFYLE